MAEEFDYLHDGMYGQYEHNLDAKGRLFVPARLREALGSPFYVMFGLKNYLLAFPAVKWKEVMAKYGALPLTQTPRFRFMLANVAKCEPDKQGRFLLTQQLRRRANLTDAVTIIGQGDHLEIWNSADYNAAEQEFFETGDLGADLGELGF